MNIARLKVLGSNYIGLFGITNDKLCFVPESIEERAVKTIENTLNVKTKQVSIYSSALLAVFAKMNNKHVYLPSFASQKEIEQIEKEIKVKIIKTQNALGNLIELNDAGAIISKTLPKKATEEIKKSGLNVLQTNVAGIEVTGSGIVATNKGFLINPRATKEEALLVEKTLGVKGGSSTANTGDALVRNSILANVHGFLIGETTTPHEINRIEEALEGQA